MCKALLWLRPALSSHTQHRALWGGPALLVPCFHGPDIILPRREPEQTLIKLTERDSRRHEQPHAAVRPVIPVSAAETPVAGLRWFQRVR